MVFLTHRDVWFSFFDHFVLLPLCRYIYFINHPGASSTEKYKVLRTTLEGKEMTTIVDGSENIQALAIDQLTGRIYWSDNHLRQIMTSDSNGTDPRVLVADVDAIHLTVYSDKLYYAVNPNQLLYVDKQSGRGSQVVQRLEVASILGVHAVNAISSTRHPCAKNNGECSHICFVGTEGQKKCGCPEGLMLHSDRKSCENAPTCKPTTFACASGSVDCIPKEWRCDGSAECSDMSDEADCPVSCKIHEFRCKDTNECIDRSRYCDKIADCTDSSDEQSCCGANEFMCRSDFSCVLKSYLRDGVRHCTDGSDEEPLASAGVTPAKPSDPYAVGIIVVLCIVSVFIIGIIACIVWRCHKRTTSLRFTDPGLTLTASLPTVVNPHELPISPIPQSVTATTNISNSSTSAGAPYDRNHVTGASSSSSSMTHLQAGYNPPPSPVTERSAFLGRTLEEDDCSTVTSYPAYRDKRRMPAPPTTPISTCDDSEPSMVNYSTQKPKVRKTRNKKYHLLKSYGASTEPYPPPPTPTRSQIYSGDEECPPSPSTVRSYRSTTNNPYPPPPSPEPTSDNS